jgi:hypothetical protein
LNATTPQRAVVYLQDGTHNVRIENCLIKNAPGATPSYATSIPIINYGFNLFVFQPDVRQVGTTTLTYSAGIVSRQKLPTGNSGNNAERLDTVVGSDNTFENNEITGFGYGIATMGIGMAIKGGINVFRPYYSTKTRIANNLIYGVRGAGIFTAYEDGARITGNRIYNVGSAATNGTGVTAAGIQAGGFDRYHNINLVVEANEISMVSADVFARGIMVEQTQNTFASVGQSGLNIEFPQVPDNATIKNNVIWGVRRTVAGAGSIGIHMLTQRDNTKTGYNFFVTPASGHEDYFSKKDRVVNNTIMMQEDNVVGNYILSGIAVQHGNATVVKNNAIMMQASASATTFGQSALLHQGIQMVDGNDAMCLNSDRNAYQLGNSAFARFIEITATSELVSNGSADEFLTIAQWRAWNRRDINSVLGDLTSMHVFNGIAPNQYLRVKTNPTPIGSVLNNRGENIAGVTTDIDAMPRGSSGQYIDIGADEFDGRQYIKDYEAITILEPSAYRSSTGAVSDAEYIMTTAPVNVRALIRNSGGLAQSNMNVTVNIYRETLTSNNLELTTPIFENAPVVSKTVKVSIDAGSEYPVDFMLDNVSPQTFDQANGYNAPYRFSTMASNVTPRYRIDVTSAYDENNPNNMTSKVVRYYIQRSTPRMLVSAVNSTTSLSGATPTQMAGRLNGDSLVAAMKKLGFINGPTNVYYDFFDRGAWEQRSVNYPLYRTLFWSGNQDALSPFERRDLRLYVNSGSTGSKKNLAVSSQEYPRKHIGLNVVNDQSFVNTILRALYVAPGTPVPSNSNYNSKRVRGDAIARNSVETVWNTSTVGDASPNPALIKPYSDATTPGLSMPAYIYVKGDRETVDSIGGSATASLINNTVYLGVDWRHWRNIGASTGAERVLRGIIDFFDKYGGNVVPVELTRFDAFVRQNTVDLSWATASEQDVHHFEVDRSDVVAGLNSDFVRVGSTNAKGNVVQTADYLLRDVNVPVGRYVYQLTTVDLDGKRSNSGMVEVEIAPDALSIASLAPLPATSQVTVNLVSPENLTATISIVNATGQTVSTINNVEILTGAQSVPVDVSNLASGTYTLVLNAPNVTLTTGLVIKR